MPPISVAYYNISRPNELFMKITFDFDDDFTRQFVRNSYEQSTLVHSNVYLNGKIDNFGMQR